MIDTPDIRDIIWNRISKYVPQEWEGWKIDELNFRFRFRRYALGEQLGVFLFNSSNNERLSQEHVVMMKEE